MKYLECERLTALSNVLDHYVTGDRVIIGRIESYSCEYTAGGSPRGSSSYASQIEPRPPARRRRARAGKAAGADKRLSKTIMRQLEREAEMIGSPTISPMASPPGGGGGGPDGSSAAAAAEISPIALAPGGGVPSGGSNRLLIHLIGTLNAALPDYDFRLGVGALRRGCAAPRVNVSPPGRAAARRRDARASSFVRCRDIAAVATRVNGDLCDVMVRARG